jgi:hypothetical protein
MTEATSNDKSIYEIQMGGRELRREEVEDGSESAGGETRL